MQAMCKLVVVGFILIGMPAMVLAADEKPDEPKETQVTAPAEESGMGIGRGLAIGGACVGAGVASIGGGFAVARIGANCIESMARQPEAAGSMFAPMIVTAAMVEGGMLFAIVVCLLGVLAG